MPQEGNNWELAPEHAHPLARRLLKDPFFWSCADDGAPLGTDTGSDALYEYREWRSKNPGNCFRLTVPETVKRWNDRASGNGPKDAMPLPKALEEDYLEIVTHDDYVIAIAFAQLVLEGAVEPEIMQMSLEAIERESTDIVISYRDWSGVKERRSRLEKMKRALEAAEHP